VYAIEVANGQRAGGRDARMVEAAKNLHLGVVGNVLAVLLGSHGDKRRDCRWKDI
jgi:hypothetical protein